MTPSRESAAALPIGTLTFMLTDMEGSTRLWEAFPREMAAALQNTEAIIEHVVSTNNGRNLKSQGEGDSSLSVFVRASDSVAAAAGLQLALSREDFGDNLMIRLRIALHTGKAELRDGDYFGPTINRCARIRAAGHGQQILLSGATFEALGTDLPDDLELTDLGSHRLKDLVEPERIYQLNVPGLPREFPPLRFVFAIDNLPTPLNSFVGRERALDDLQQRLRAYRLVTVTGTGGIGKSRLVREVAEAVLREFPDGVYLAGIEGINGGGVLQLVASILGVREAGPTDLMSNVVSHLNHRRILLLLDGCEHALEGCASFAKAVLAAAPNLRILATSREALGVEGEAQYPLSPLELAASEPAFLSESEKLFMERARSARPDFSISAGDRDRIAAISRHLDGIPLAIELAAARTRVLSVKQIEARLAADMSVLSDRKNTGPTDRSLFAALEGSFESLDPGERRLAARISVFVGGFDLEGAEAVCSGFGLSKEEILDLLSALSGKSLIVSEYGDEWVRFRMLKPVRWFASILLEADEDVERLRISHATYFMELAERANLQIRGSGQVSWLKRLDTEWANMRLALATSQALLPRDQFARMTTALARYWYMRGTLTEGRKWLHHAIDKQGEVSERMVGSLYGAAGSLARAQGDYAVAGPLYERSLQAYEATNEPNLIAWAFRSLAALAQEQGQYEKASELYEQSLELSRSVGDDLGTTEALHGLGSVLESRGEKSSAWAIRNEEIQLARKTGDGWALGVALNDLGWSLQAAGDLQAAKGSHEEALSTFEGIGGPWGAAFARLGLAQIERAEGRPEEAGELAKIAIEQAARVGDQRLQALGLSVLALASITAGRFSLAAELIIESVSMSKSNPESGVASSILLSAALLAASLGECKDAARFLEGSESISASASPYSAMRIDREKIRGLCPDAVPDREVVIDHRHAPRQPALLLASVEQSLTLLRSRSA